MGWKKFKADTLKKTGILLSDEMAKRVVAAYRRKNKEIVAFWRDIEDAFRRAIKGEATKLCSGRVHVMPMQRPWRGVQIRLPSGSYLYYHGACERQREVEEEYVVLENGVETIHTVKKIKNCLSYLTDEGGFVGLTDVYGGLLTEHITSAASRDLILPSIWRLEEAGFDILNTIHDELWGQATPGRGEEFKKIMCINPSWCDMRIEADLKSGVRYLK